MFAWKLMAQLSPYILISSESHTKVTSLIWFTETFIYTQYLHPYLILSTYRGYPAKRALYAWRVGPFWQDTLDIWNGLETIS